MEEIEKDTKERESGKNRVGAIFQSYICLSVGQFIHRHSWPGLSDSLL